MKRFCEVCEKMKKNCKGERYSGVVVCPECVKKAEAEYPDSDAEWLNLDEDGCMIFKE